MRYLIGLMVAGLALAEDVDETVTADSELAPAMEAR